MAIFGSNYPKLVVSSSALEISLEEARVEYDFIQPDVIEHVSVFTGFRSYPYNRSKSSFRLDIILSNYSSSQAIDKLNDIYQNRNSTFLVYPHSNGSASADVYGSPIEYYLTEFTPYYMSNDITYDALMLTLTPRKNSILVSVDVSLGYGYAYGLNYGIGL